MSKLMKRVLAIGSASVLVAAGLSVGAAPAYAAGEVTIKATTGTSLTVFNTDELSLTTTVVTAAVSATNLSYAITDPDQGKWYIKVGDITSATGTTATSTITVAAKNSLGANVDVERATTASVETTTALAAVDQGSVDGFATVESQKFGEIVVDFAVLGATTVYLSGIASAGASNVLSISPFGGTPANGLAVLTSSAAAPVGNTSELDFGDGAASATIQSWIDLNADIDDVEANYASPVYAMDWVDPKATAVIPTIERFVTKGNAFKLNDTTSGGNLATVIRFIPEVNTDQIDITKWEYKIEESDGTVVGAAETFEAADAVGQKGDKTTRSGPKLFTVLKAASAALSLLTTKDYVVSVASVDSSAVWFAGAAFVPASNAATVTHIEAAVSSTAGNHLQTSAQDLSVQLRAGSGVVKYTAQTKTADTTNSTTPSIQVLAVVETGAFMSTGGSVSVSGSTSPLTKANTSVIVGGFTNSKGQFDLTVTSSAVASEAYTVTFYVLSGAGDNFVKLNRTTGGFDAVYVATYEAGTATTLTADSSVLSGANVTAGFTVTDQFGIGTNKRGTKTVSVELKAANIVNLDKDAAVAADGTVSFTFANYVTAGAADVISATTYTGSASAPVGIGGALTKTVTLYNPAAASAVQVPATLSTNVTYGDFLADDTKATTALPAPLSGDLLLLTGTVVDASGAGVPAGVVTIAAEGFQFQQVGSTKYYNDKITVSASAAGVYNVNMWTHIASATGVSVVSTTADGKTATTTVKSYLPATGVNGNNLVFELAMPANVVKNTTYAVTAKLTDKWGNPIQTSARSSVNAVSIQGVGSIQINSDNAATTKNFGKDGTTTVFLRSVKDIAGPGSVTASLAIADYSATSASTATALNISEIVTDVVTTVWNETLFANSIDASVEVLDSAADIVTTQKVNAGSFKGYVALYALGYEGQRMSAKVGNDWVIVPAIPARTNDLFRAVEFVGAGVDISVRIYIDRVLLATIPLLTM
jgi:hypothetical protein